MASCPFFTGIFTKSGPPWHTHKILSIFTLRRPLFVKRLTVFLKLYCLCRHVVRNFPSFLVCNRIPLSFGGLILCGHVRFVTPHEHREIRPRPGKIWPSPLMFLDVVTGSGISTRLKPGQAEPSLEHSFWALRKDPPCWS